MNPFQIPVGKLLTRRELSSVERRLEEIDRLLEFLDPSNAIESKRIDLLKYELSYYIEVLEVSHKKARIKESGLRLVHP
jgi:hypothetical protein